ncbi:MAG: hypothetical protein EA414_19270 [Arthrospira sp. PLM2.Bin9]|nr:hypothetical protein [Arthrospira sp. PLM2.Bin9]TVU52106.1 MAG: hypothetical protein EA414_19270 [Arthrospira sp. PLM2.Bin9]
MINLHKTYLYMVGFLVLFMGFSGVSSAAILSVNKELNPTDIWAQNPSFINRNSANQRYLIQKEVNHTRKRLNPFLNTWILIAVLIPSTISITILIWFFRQAQQVQACCQNLEAYKEEILEQIRYMTENAQDIIDEIDTNVNLSEVQIEVIVSQIESLSIEDGKNSAFTVETENLEVQ